MRKENINERINALYKSIERKEFETIIRAFDSDNRLVYREVEGREIEWYDHSETGDVNFRYHLDLNDKTEFIEIVQEDSRIEKIYLED